MKPVVVDTNVAVVANGDSAGCRPNCRLATIDFLESLMHKGTIAIDLSGEIEEEYRRNLSLGTPGVGTRFLQRFFADSANRIERFDTTAVKKSFKFDGSLKRFDPSDRKFVLVALEAKSEVINAVDSDWLEHDDELSRRGVRVRYLCGKKRADWLV